MQEQRERNYLRLQVNRLHNSVHYDSSSLLDDPAMDAVQSVSDHCAPSCPFSPCPDEDVLSEAESSVGPDEAIWNVLDDSEGHPTRVADSLFWNLTEGKCPPETTILYED